MEAAKIIRFPGPAAGKTARPALDLLPYERRAEARFRLRRRISRVMAVLEALTTAGIGFGVLLCAAAVLAML